ncbi:hypothetical protein QJS83_06605 [Bdellovibrio sp. 22V]|uniref:hypothetical protein n=1 Tax=Bdellovibrio sp. 22V TaxID=3044166 RepID=UPI002542EA34|nr:hypothetical protein [Bdellovibrio sp. 22V]WII73541.1 hypothetical protein QJS83_06605 [Bdellovibrio sp. 22V]
MLRSWSLSISFIFLSFSAFASNPQRAFMEQFSSSRISFPDEESPLLSDSPGRYPGPLNFLFENVLSWIPRGEPKLMSAQCAPHVWKGRMMDSRLASSPQLQGALMQKYFQECRSEIETGDNGYFANVMGMMTMKYQPQAHPFLRRVVVNLPGNVKLKGLLALKGDMKRRPLVIVRLGIFSSIEDFKPERAWLMMLFEQGPFNVLMLENMTSPDFVANNNQFSFGGYDEGIQNILVAKLLTDSNEPLSSLVDSVHIFGISLGGHGVLYSSLLNKFNSPSSRPLIRSFTALCPVVNLQSTMQSLTQAGGVKAAFVDFWGRQRLEGLNKKIPALLTYDSFAYLSKVISEITRTYHGGLSYISKVQLPPGMKDSGDFWAVNDFWKFYKQVEQPVLIYATNQDPAVPFELNSQKLQNKEMKIDSKNIRVVDLPQGMHCTLPISYDWSVLATVFQSYILSHSPDFKMVERFLEVDMSDEEWKGFFDEGSRVRFEVQEPNKKSGFATIALEIENSKGDEKSMNLSLPLSQFDFRFLNPEMSSSEQEMIVRWLNQNLKLRIEPKNGKYTLKATWPVAL